MCDSFTREWFIGSNNYHFLIVLFNCLHHLSREEFQMRNRNAPAKSKLNNNFLTQHFVRRLSIKSVMLLNEIIYYKSLAELN